MDVVRMNEVFSKEDHDFMKMDKERTRKSLGLKRLCWRDYILHLSGAKRFGQK